MRTLNIFLDFLSTIKDNDGSDLESRSWYSGLNQASGIMLFRYGPPISWVMESNEQWQRDDYHWYGKWTLKWQERSNRNIRKCASARQRERHWRFHSLIIPHVSVLIRSKILTVCSRAWPLRTCPRRQWQFVLGFTLRNCKAKLIDEVCLWSREMWKEKKLACVLSNEDLWEYSGTQMRCNSYNLKGCSPSAGYAKGTSLTTLTELIRGFQSVTCTYSGGRHSTSETAQNKKKKEKEMQILWLEAKHKLGEKNLSE